MRSSHAAGRLATTAAILAAVVASASAASAVAAASPFKQVAVINTWPELAKIQLCGYDQYQTAQHTPLYVCTEPTTIAAPFVPYTLPNWWWQEGTSLEINEWSASGQEVTAACAITSDQSGKWQTCSGYQPPPLISPQPLPTAPAPTPNAGYCHPGSQSVDPVTGEPALRGVNTRWREVFCDLVRGSIPVMQTPSASAPEIGHLTGGGYANWFVFQLQAGTYVTPNGSRSHMWALALVRPRSKTNPHSTYGFVSEAWFAAGQSGESANPAALPVQKVPH